MKPPKEGTASLQTILSLLMSHPGLSSATTMILHGSHAWGTARSGSDVDIVCIYESGVMSAEYLHTEEFEIDVLWVRKDELAQQFERLPSENNSPLLRALAYGHVVLDRIGDMQSIRDRALSIWTQGPRVPRERESQELTMHSLKVVQSLKRWMEQTDLDVYKERFMWLHADRIFYILVYRYYLLHGMWSQELRKMLVEAKIKMPSFYCQCTSYLEAQSLSEALVALQKLADACVRPNLLDEA